MDNVKRPSGFSIRGNMLPTSYNAAAVDGRLKEAFGREMDRDADGNMVGLSFEPYEASVDTLTDRTEAVERDYRPRSGAVYVPTPEEAPGHIPLIDDFSKIVCFADGGDGGPICFDFRDDPVEPSVIWWADAYWVRVAPDFESLLSLLSA